MPPRPGEVDGRVAVEFARPRSATDDLQGLLRAQLFLGLVGPLGADLDLPFLLIRDAEGTSAGLGNLSLGLKCRFFEGAGIGLALGAALILPTASLSRTLDEERQVELELSLGWAIWLSERFSAQGNFGYGRALVSGEQELFQELSIAVALPLGLRGFVESLLNVEPKTSTVELSLGPGLKLDLGEDAFVALGVVAGITDAAQPLRIIAQVQRGF